MGLPAEKPRLTAEEYLALEREAKFKSEFFDGEMFAMAGGTVIHSLIATNLVSQMRTRLRGKPCLPFNSDLRILVEESELYTYPDLSVVCGPLHTATPEGDVLLNPTLIAEVLSDSTEAYDRGKKFELYRKIPTLREYLLVSQKEPRIEAFSRTKTGPWQFREAAGLSAKLKIPCLDIALSLKEIFANVTFAPSSIRAQIKRS